MSKKEQEQEKISKEKKDAALIAEAKKKHSKQKKSPLPLLLTLIFTGGILFVLLADWERYPTQEEMQRYLADQYNQAAKVEVHQLESFKEEFAKGQIYHVKIHYHNGTVAEDSITIKKSDRRPIYPWHDYYDGLYRKDLETE